MMLTHIDPRYLDTVWPEVSPLLADAVAKNRGECDLSQLRAQIAYGGAQLLVWHEGDDVVSAASIEFKQYPNFRAAHVAYLAGKTSPEFWDAFRDWARKTGASCVESLCGAGEERLFQHYGMETTYRMMRASL
jgi:hypothetical protein